MPIFKVRKRNGGIESFDRSRIERAIKKAFEAHRPDGIAESASITDEVVSELESQADTIPDIENIQDSVERVLMQRGYEDVARAYILYREEHARLRQGRDIVVEVGRTMDEYLSKADWRVNENANSGYSLGGLILNTSGKVTANYWLSHIYPRHIGDTHRNGDLHIHDLSMFAGYCAGWSLRMLLEEGFNGIPSAMESTPPMNLQSAVNQMINFFGTLQNEWAGAQAFSSFDTYLSPFVHKYRKELEEQLETVNASFESDSARETHIEDRVYRYVVQNMQNFVFGMNVPSRWGTQTPFTNITLDWTCPDDLSEKRLQMGGYDRAPYEKTFGELDRERRLINRALIEVYLAGDAKGRVFTFPIPTYNITEDFPWDDPDVDALFEMTAKYGIPYFQNFVGSQYEYTRNPDGSIERRKNEHAYEPGAVRSMCCRLQLDLRELLKRGNGLFGSAEMTGSLGVVTINLPRIGALCALDRDGFFQRLRTLMDTAKESLEIKRRVLSDWLDRGLYPATARYLKTFRNHFSTIGINGMNEAIRNFSRDEHTISTEHGRAFALEILDFMRDVLREYQEETGNLYNLEATPAEGTTYRFAREDRAQIPGIIQAGTEEAPFYTNSSQLPVGYTDDAFQALDAQDELQCRYTGGTVMHLYLGERISDIRACKALVRRVVSRYRMPYITITPTFSVCPIHGYIPGEHDFCPRCDEEMGYTGEDDRDHETRARYTERREAKIADALAVSDTG